MQSSSITTVNYKLDPAEQFNVATTSDYAGENFTLRVEFIETIAANGSMPHRVILSGVKVRKDGAPGKVWTERKLSTRDDTDELGQFPAAILAAVGLA